MSALFVDLRGYSSFAERHSPEQSFQLIQDFTHRAAQIICDCRGQLTGWSGDGMMAFFGVCDNGAKEQAALRAGLALIQAFASTGAPGSTPLGVAVGISTREVYAGTVSWESRSMWVAAGNAPIVAARLHAATRELQASIAIDETTWTRAGELSALFTKRAELPLKGRAQPECVYSLMCSELPRGGAQEHRECPDTGHRRPARSARRERIPMQNICQSKHAAERNELGGRRALAALRG